MPVATGVDCWVVNDREGMKESGRREEEYVLEEVERDCLKGDRCVDSKPEGYY